MHVDERLIVVDKAAGISLATPRARTSAASARLLASLPEADRTLFRGAELLLVHRLDVGTSGLVLLAWAAEVHRELVRAFAERRVEKTYVAAVWGHPRPACGSWTEPLGPDRADRRRMRVDPHGRPARSDYRVIAGAPHVALLALAPRTGRTHQLRVHLAAAGHPIVGDDLYGGPRHRAVSDPVLRRLLDPDRPLLHAWRLLIPSPPLPQPLVLAAPWPADLSALGRVVGWSESIAPPGEI